MKTIVVLSGGLDSTVLLWHLLNRGDEVKAISIDYGQRHRRELEHAQAIASLANVQHEIADLSALRPLLAGSSQTSDLPVPHGHYAEETMKLTVVPFRNALMLSVASAWAISNKADSIAFGAHAGDHAIYPDCRPEFAEKFDELLAIADWHRVRLERPFITNTKADIVKKGVELNAPFGLTYSCYEGEKVACGRCGTCSERLLSFDEAATIDPLEYKDREFYKTLK